MVIVVIAVVMVIVSLRLFCNKLFQVGEALVHLDPDLVTSVEVSVAFSFMVLLICSHP